VPIVKKSGDLTYPEPLGPHRPVAGQLYFFTLNYLYFTEPHGTLPCSELPVACPCPKPDQSSPRLSSCFLQSHFNIILPSMPRFPSDNEPDQSDSQPYYIS